MLLAGFVRAHIAYCIFGIIGLASLISGNLLGSLGIAEIFRDSIEGAVANDIPIWERRGFASQFYAAIFISMVFVCFVERRRPVPNKDGKSTSLTPGTVIWSAARLQASYIFLPLPVLFAAVLPAPSFVDAASYSAIAGFALAQIVVFVWFALIAANPQRRNATVTWLVVAALFFACLGLMLKPLTPGDAFFAVFGWLTLAYIVFFYGDWLLLVGLMAVVIGWHAYVLLSDSQSGHEPYRLAGLRFSASESYYAAHRRARLSQTAAIASLECSSEKTGGTSCRRQSPSELLEAWRRERKLDKPKIVIVAASGGAYRATFWTAHILDTLIEHSKQRGALEHFTDHIRLVTGASGGMVGVTYFAVCHREDLDSSSTNSIAAIIEHDVGGGDGQGTCMPPQKLANGPIDSLLPIADHMARRDLADVLFPRVRGDDRGVILERQWRSIGVTFDAMADLLRGQFRPAIIFTPTVAENGTPLELSSLRWNPNSASTGRPNLFDTFPEAHRTLSLATAARLSATYPVITPAAELPTLPNSLHLVDAGYFDNDGMDAAARYLQDPGVVDWLAANSSGVILLSLRAFPRADDGAAFVAGRCEVLSRNSDATSSKFSRLLRRIADLLPQPPTPLRALVEVRSQAAIIQTNTLVDNLKARLESRKIEFDFVPFENTTAVNMSWYLKRSELNCLKDAARSADSFKTLQEIWSRRRRAE